MTDFVNLKIDVSVTGLRVTKLSRCNTSDRVATTSHRATKRGARNSGTLELEVTQPADF